MSSKAPSAKPSLTGASTKQRKSARVAKFEPNVFRDTLIKHLESVPQGDFDGYAKKLDELGSTLDFRKYEQELFSLLIVGRLLAPGGSLIQDGAPSSPFSLLTSANKEPADITQVKKVVEVFNKMMRRYKYLQKDFEESSLPTILQHVNKYDDTSAVTSNTPGATTPLTKTASLPVPEAIANLQISNASQPPSRPSTPTVGITLPPSRPNQDKMAMATALFVTQGLAIPSVLAAVRKDHLIKDGSALGFLVVYLRTFLSVENLDALNLTLRRGGINDLLDFFPSNRRTVPELTAFFKSQKLDVIADQVSKQRSAEVIKSTLAHLKEMVSGSESNEEIVAYLKQQEKARAVSDENWMSLIWSGVVSGVDLTVESSQAVSEAVLKETKELATILEAFATTARTEISLINAIQVWCHEHPQVSNATFVKILVTLFNADVLSSEAIQYWYNKGSKAQGRPTFLKAAEPFLAKLHEQDEEEDEEE